MKVHLTTAYPEMASAVAHFRDLAAGDRFKVHRVEEDPAAADVILFCDSRADNNDWRMARIRNHPLVKQYREKCFVYCEADQPWCGMPGLYVSMPGDCFDRRRQRAAAYVNYINGQVTPRAETTSDLLFSFMGRRCHPMRDQILSLSHSRAVIEDTTKINFFGAAGEEIERAKKHYADVLARSKFVICPRGTGTASFRLFETIAVGRVPVIISDEWVAPDGPDWDAFSLRVAERDVARVAEIIEAAERRWPEMAAACTEAWRMWLAPEAYFHRAVEACADIAKKRGAPEALLSRIPSRRFARLWLREAKKKVLDAVSARSADATSGGLVTGKA